MSSDFCVSDAPLDDDLAIAEMDLSLDLGSKQDNSPAKVEHDLDADLCDGLDLISETHSIEPTKQQ